MVKYESVNILKKKNISLYDVHGVTGNSLEKNKWKPWAILKTPMHFKLLDIKKNIVLS